MANDYSRADIVAVWEFEGDANGMLADTKAIQPALAATGPPTADTTNQMDGAQCASFAAGQYYAIPDANLAAGFPTKSGDVLKQLTISGYVRPTTVDANKRRIWAKCNTTGNQRSWFLSHNSTAIYLDYSLNGSSFATAIAMTAAPMVANQKYFISLSIDGIGAGTYPRYWFRMYDVTGAVWYSKFGLLATGSLFCGTADFRIGSDDQVAANTTFIGQIDTTSVSNARMHNTEAAALYGGTFPITGVAIYDLLYDPVNGSDSYDGFSAWAKAKKTLRYALSPGDRIYMAKSAETAQAGTCTATKYSRTVTTTSDLSAVLPQYSIIRFDTDGALYMVKSITSSVITLYRVYEGTSGSGKVANKITALTGVATGDLYPATTTCGTIANPALIIGGVNPANNVQDGWSIINSTPTYWTGNNLYNINISRVGSDHGSYFLYYTLADCVLDDIYFGRVSMQIGSMFRCTWNHPMADLQSWGSAGIYRTVINDLQVGPSNGSAINLTGICMDVTFNNPVHTGDGGASAAFIEPAGSQLLNVRVVNPLIDVTGEMAGVGGGVIVRYTNGMCKDFVIINPTIPKMGFWANGVLGNTTYVTSGEVNLVNINGSETDHVKYIGLEVSGIGSSGEFAHLSPDYNIFNIAAPSVRIAMPTAFQVGSVSRVPINRRHEIPCEAGVTRTISAYLRKSSSPIQAIGLTGGNGGSGYVPGDVFEVQQGATGRGSILKVATIGGGGAVASMWINRGGWLYTVANAIDTVAITGVGTGCRINITAVGIGYGNVADGLVSPDWYLPFMRLRWVTGSPGSLVNNVHDVPMADVNDAFQLVSYAVTPSIKGTISVEFWGCTPNHNSFFWYDDLSG